MYLTSKTKFNRLAEVIKHIPGDAEFVIVFDKGEIKDIKGDNIAEFSIALFNRVETETKIVVPKLNGMTTQEFNDSIHNMD